MKTVLEVLNEIGYPIISEHGEEIVIHCPFSGCDEDSRDKEGHCYINTTKNVYHCKKCSASGRIEKLYQQLGVTAEKKSTFKHYPRFDNAFVEKGVSQIGQALAYLNERGIKEEILRDARVGYNQTPDGTFISFPYFDDKGKPLFTKLRRYPEVEGKERYRTYPGSKSDPTMLYRQQSLIHTSKEVFVTEGEIDTLTLLQAGLPSVGLPNGAKKLREEQLHLFEHLEQVFICLDKDPAGKEAASAIADQLAARHEGQRIWVIDWKNTTASIKDVNDLFRSQDAPDFKSMFKEHQPGFRRRPSLPPLTRTVDYQDWHTTVCTALPKLEPHVVVCASAFAQLMIKDVTNPFAVILEGAPASGKTTCLSLFQEAKAVVHVTDRVTSAAFVSNSSQVSKEKLADVDLLPKIQYKTLICNDLGSWFSMKEDDLEDALGKFTRVMDGHGLSTDTGTHGHRGYSGEYLFMMLGACVTIQKKVRDRMGNLGPRLFMLKMPPIEHQSDEALLASLSHSYGDQQKRLQRVTKDFIYSLWIKHPDGIEWDRSSDDRRILEALLTLAKTLSKLRGTLDKQSGKMLVESPERALQILYNVTRGIAILQGRQRITGAELPYVLKLVLDSGAPSESLTLSALLAHDGQVDAKTLSAMRGVSVQQARTYMKDFAPLGIAHLSKEKGEPNLLRLEDGDLLALYQGLAARRAGK